MSRRSFAATAGLSVAAALAGITGPITAGAETKAGTAKKTAFKKTGPDAYWVRPVAGHEEESLPDGSTGRVSEFRGCDGTYVAAYLRRPKGNGPFPIVVILHGGGVGPNAAYGMGRGNPLAASFTAAGWAILSIDFRVTDVPLSTPGGAIPFPTLPPIEWHDAMASVEAARNLYFTDSRRIAVIAGSHGGYVMSHVLTRCDIQAGVLCSPAMFDFIELSKANDNKAEMIQHIKDKIAEAEQRYGAKMEVVAKNPECYGYESAMTEAEKVRCPVMLINGTNDTSSPIAVMYAYRDKLKSLGKTVDTFFPDNAPHGFYFGSPKPLHPQTDDAITHATEFIKRSFADVS